jgi:hypothetical protein
MTGALATIELMIQDPALANGGDGASALVERKRLTIEDDIANRFLDGPVCRTIAVVDFDPATGQPLAAPVAFTPSPTQPTHGKYDTADLPHEDPRFLAVNCFGTVFETVRMFEERAALGRPVVWAFDGEQLLVVPRAGLWANAYYERATRSLQFFYFDAGSTRIYTALSRDIVAHECGHALLDAVVPSLYDSLTPESIAIHEAVADLVAVLMALRSAPLRRRVLAESGNSISDSTAFSSIAEQFGASRPTPDNPHPIALRNLHNDETMATVNRGEPHDLSTVLSAIFYDTLVDLFDGLKDRPLAEPSGDAARDADRQAARALGTAEIVFRRLLLRGIDYLPPGDLTFADVGRATLAADRAAVADADDDRKAESRARFAQRFVDRKVVEHVDELEVSAPRSLAYPPDQLESLRESDWVAYGFVEAHREELGIPPDVSFEVLPRVDATKEIGRRQADRSFATQRELILKVAWDELEPNGASGITASQRRIPTGATLALRWEDGEPIALVRSDVTLASHREQRDAMLQRMLDVDVISVRDADDGVVWQGPSAELEVRITGDVARVRGTQQLLHGVVADDDGIVATQEVVA